MERVLLGLSGGVDSSVALYLLKKAGYHVDCAFMRNWDSALNNDVLGNSTINDDICPQERDYKDAMDVAAALDTKLYRVDFIEEYWNTVFKYFLDEYKSFRTPNPDILCNKNIKFNAFLNFAIKNNADYIAMGHYARVEHGPLKSYLLKSKDENKDQTYFLCMINQEMLRKSLFPLGDLSKNEVREIASRLGLVTKDKKDSTGICFIGERNFKEFLKNYLPACPGNIVTVEGDILGSHDGLMYYTIGQRKGLNIGGMNNFDCSAWYVVGKRLCTNELIVGQGEDNILLYSTRCICDSLNEIADPLEINKTYKVRIRHRGSLHDAKVTSKEDKLVVEFLNPIRSVTPGQAIVFYDGEICMGGAFIKEAYYNDEKREY